MSKKNKKKNALPSGNVRYRLYTGTDASGKKQYKSFTASTMREAKQKAQEWQLDHPTRPIGNPTFAEAAQAFLVNRRAVLSPSTYDDYQRRISRIETLYPDFAKKHMSVIVSEDVQRIVTDLAARKKENAAVRSKGRELSGTVSPKTVRNYYGIIRDVLSAHGVVIQGIRLPQRRPTQLQIPENDIVSALLEDIKGTELEIPVLLAAFGPMRRGEICALKMEDINFDTDTVHVRRSLVRDADGYIVEKGPKSAAGDRFIKYPHYVTALIKERGYVSKMAPDTLSKRFFRTLDRHGYKHFRFHDLRHFAASFQIALGIPPQYVMERGGWSSGQTMQRYIHALDQQKKTMSDKANDAFEKLL